MVLPHVNWLKKNSNCGLVYRCTKKNCRKTISIFFGTVFEKLCIKKLIYVVGCWIQNKKISEVVRDGGVDEKTVFKFYNLIRNSIDSAYNNNIQMLGGPGLIVEMDETHLFTRKYNRGNILASQQIWVFGLIERVSKKCYMEVVERRDAETLFEVVSRVLHPETLIIGDSWRGYSIIKRHFETLHINHRLHFVDPNNRNIHTNNIERLWRSVKNEVRGICNINYKKSLKVFCYKRNCLVGTFYEKICKILKIIFTIDE